MRKTAWTTSTIVALLLIITTPAAQTQSDTPIRPNREAPGEFLYGQTQDFISLYWPLKKSSGAKSADRKSRTSPTII
jgi:hypothetical protein